MAKKKLRLCQSGHDFVKYAKKNGAEIVNGKGSHCKVRVGKQFAIVPRHDKDLGKGLQRKIFKAFVAMGITAFLFGCVITCYPW